MLWHQRLGHPSYSSLQKIDCLTSIFNSKCNETQCDITSCTVCPLSKQHMLPFPKSNTHSSSPFDLLHCDLWGPYRVSTMNGCKYFLAIVDDFSRSTWTCLMPTKDHVFSHLKNFQAYVHNHFQTTIKTFRSDNGTEFVNSQVIPFLLSLGIVQQTSCPGTPQQNGVVIRKHHLLDISRSLRFQAGLPIHFWVNAFSQPHILSIFSPPGLLNSRHHISCFITHLLSMNT